MTLRRKVLVFICCFICLLYGNKIKVSAAEMQRFGGADRYETSIQISQSHFEASDYIIVVSGSTFPDALSAAPLSKRYNAPILLTKGDSLNENMIKEIQRLNAKNAFILGGPSIISDSVKKQLEDLNIVSNRIYGKDRFETSIKVAEILGTYDKAFIVSGENFPDAVSAAPIAALKEMPIILTKRKEFPSTVKEFVDRNSNSMYYIVGGDGAVSDASVSSISNSKRLSGQDRYKTNEAIVKEFLDEVVFENTYVANGLDFPDALSGAAAAVKTSSPIILVSNYYDIKNSIIKSNLDNIAILSILGGKGAISNELANKIINGGMIKVVLDPGHGGYDSGAVGPTGKYEKDVTLAITLKVGQILKDNGIEVVYTRDSDKVSWPSNVSEDLKKRVQIAKDANAQYFVSIHANSATPAANGTETFYYESNAGGKKLAQEIQNKLISVTGLNNRGIKTANFYVIKNLDIPAALVEVAFISNPTEEKLLTNIDFQNKAAGAIAEGIINTVRASR